MGEQAVCGEVEREEDEIHSGAREESTDFTNRGYNSLSAVDSLTGWLNGFSFRVMRCA